MLIVEYDGTSYHGFQRQKGLTTIQGEMEKAIGLLTGGEVRLAAASRTDAGAHAKGQVVNFHTERTYPAQTWVEGLNFYLPGNIVVLEAREVREGFHARRSARSREYRYLVLNRRVPSPFLRFRAYHFPYSLDLEAMQEAATFLVGSHDFAAFCSLKEGRGRNARRRILGVDIHREGELVVFDFVGDSFLPQQVRTMVGTLLLVGAGRMGVSGFQQVLQGRDRSQAGPTAPAWGLYLMRVNYQGD
jgi:tRNA pseudouridine38-40 synthase